MRHDQVELRILDTATIDGQQVQVDDAGTVASALRVAAHRQLDALQLEQQLDRLEIGLQLHCGVEKPRLVEHVARGCFVKGRGAHHVADLAHLGRDRGE